MPLSNHDSGMIRRYLLGKLTDEEIAATEQRLLTEDDFFEEFELIKDDLVEEYVAKELSDDESRWLEQNFLASSEGKQRAQFAKVLDRYVVSTQRAQEKRTSWTDSIAAFWNFQPLLLRVGAALAVVAILAVVFWPSRGPAPQSFATLTLTNISSTRSSGDEYPKIKVDGKGLRLTLLLPAPVSPPVRYRVEINGKGETKTFDVTGNETQSVSIEIPGDQLIHGAQVATLSIINSDGTTPRIPGGYHFTVES